MTGTRSHKPIEVTIMAALCSANKLEFRFLRETARHCESLLSEHLMTLESPDRQERADAILGLLVRCAIGPTRETVKGMTSRISALAIDAAQPHLVADFWCAVLGWAVLEEDDEGVSIAPESMTWPTIDVLAVPEAKSVKNRLHLDVRADGRTTEEELSRLLALGAHRVDVGQSADVSWTVLSDPEGNEFCLLGRTVQEL